MKNGNSASEVEDVADRLVRQAFLYDFYGELLTEHQRQSYEAYVCDNLSISEIAQEGKVSRQSVYDLIKRCDAILEGYEKKLHLFEKFQIMKRDITRIHGLAMDEKQSESSRLEDIRTISGYLLDEL